MPNKDVDLAGGFRLDLKTGLILLALAGQWYDGRSQSKQQAERLTESLIEVKRNQAMQAIDLADIKLALAARGIFLRQSQPPQPEEKK